MIGCSRDNSGVILNPESNAQSQKVEIYCRTSNSLLSIVEFSYKNGRVVYEKETKDIPLKSISEKFYEYNLQNQLIKVKNVYTSLNEDGSVRNKSEYSTTREYKNNLLYKEFMDEARQAYYLYAYKNGTLETKTYYDKNGIQGTTSFSYANGLLSQELSASPGSTNTTLILYEYDAEKRLSRVKAKQNNQESKVIAEYFYQGDKLIRKEIYGWGIDPCFDLCCRNWTYKYSY